MTLRSCGIDAGKASCLCFLVLVAVLGQACAANPGGSNSNQPDSKQGVQKSDNADQAGKKHPDGSSYKPARLLIAIDFEEQEIRPNPGNSGFDRLILKPGSGSAAAMGIMYEGGREKDRRARIVADPQDPDNRVLQYWLRSARVPGQTAGQFKGRIQLGLSRLNAAMLFQRFRLYLPPDMKLYRQYPEGNGWFTINEMWMGARWQGHPFPFRLGVNIIKPAGAGKPLYFVASGDVSAGGAIRHGRWKSVWHQVGVDFQVPVGEWIDIEIGYRQGDARTGRFYLGAKRQQDKRYTTVIDVTNWTYHPDSPKPVPVTDWQPLKLYTGGKIIEYIRNNGGVTQLYFDDLQIYGEW